MAAPSPTVSQQGLGVVPADQLNTYVQTCTNLAQLRAFVGLAGMRADLQGYVSAGDGGGGPFYWSSGSYTDNGVSIIVPSGASNGAWLRLAYYSSYPWVLATTVSTLPTPTAALLGARSFVTDATATTFNSIVAGGGANAVPVYCDGAAWRVG